jgi:hypothetical protein
VRASRRATISWQKSTSTRYDGSVSRATDLVLALASAPSSVAGPGLASSSYDATRHQLRLSFSQASAFVVQLAPPAPLPVVLTTFTARRQPAGRIALAWQTASELGSRGFAVQRQLQPGAAFETLSFVPSQGQPQQPTSYTYLDAAAPGATVYYRLQQLDTNGATTYSPVVTVTAAPVAATLLTWPQPAQHTLWVQFSDPLPVLTLHLLDATGRLVRQVRFQQQLQLDVSTLGPGLYYLQAQDEGGQTLASQKVLVTH